MVFLPWNINIHTYRLTDMTNKAYLSVMLESPPLHHSLSLTSSALDHSTTSIRRQIKQLQNL
jgi:hypothetical protein